MTPHADRRGRIAVALVLALALVLCLGTAFPTSVSGQETSAASPPSVGSRLRVTMEGAAVATGSMAYLRSDTLGLRLPGWALVRPVPLDSVARVETSAGERSRLVPCTLIGAVLGAGVGVLTAAGSDSDELMGRAIARGSLLGGGIGLVAGLFSRGEAWKPVPLEALRTGSEPGSRSGTRSPPRASTLVLWRLPLRLRRRSPPWSPSASGAPCRTGSR